MNHFSHFLSYCLLLLPFTVIGCAQHPASEDHLKPVAWIPANDNLLKQPLDVKRCMDKQQNIQTRNFSFTGLGAILHPHLQSVRTQTWKTLLTSQNADSKSDLPENLIAVSVIPYLIDSSKQMFLIAPKYPKTATDNFDRFLPACQPGLGGLPDELLRMPYYYPTVTLTTEVEQRDHLMTVLKRRLASDCLSGEFAQDIISIAQPPKNMYDFFRQLFAHSQVSFLQNVFSVTQVTLADTDIQFSPTTLVYNPSPQVNPPSPLPTSPQSIQVTLSWPQSLGELNISSCEDAQKTDKNYQSTCSFRAGTVQKISASSVSPENSGPSSQLPKKRNARKLMIVSLSAELDVEGTGKIIQNALYNVFKSLKNSKIPVTLLAIGSGRQLSNPILTGEELPNLAIGGELDELRAKLRQLQFSATDLNALDDLELIDVYTTNHAIPVDRILYLTDNMHLSDTPPRKQLGVPLGWHKDGIQLTVLTTQRCNLWTEQAAANCVSWQTKQLEELEKVMREFLQ